MSLLERQPALDSLAGLRREAFSQAGRIVLVGGEAGIGKTSLLRHFAPDAPWGACDPLATPRPLGPVVDLAPAMGPAVVDALAQDGHRARLFDAVLAALARQPGCWVIEDLHWADEATLDLLAWLGRRITQTRALLLASYRDDETGPRHPLRRVLGALPGAARLNLQRLSADAVRQLARDPAADIAALLRVTGGNPFFVTELLAVQGSASVPPTVRDAVLARVARLPAEAQNLLDAAAVLGPRIEPGLLQAVAPHELAQLEALLAAGVLQEAGGHLEFRHELARQAVLTAQSAPRRQAFHRRALQALAAVPGAEAARLAEHAEAAGDRAAVLEHARRAAREAAALGARRQAQQQYARALRAADDLPDDELAPLLEAFAFECLAVGERQAGVDARRRAAALRAGRGEPLAQAENLCRLTNLLVGMGRSAEADQALQQAFALLAPLPPGRELAYAWRTQAHLSLLRNLDEPAVQAAERAIVLGQAAGDLETEISALNSKGAAVARSDFAAGCVWLERSRALAQAAGRMNQVFNADINLCEAALEVRDYPLARAHAERADELALDRQMERCTTLSRIALCALYQGQWDEAGELAHGALAELTDMHVNRAIARLVLGRLRARRGDAGAWAALDDCLQLARSTGYLEHLAPVHAARAEAAWLDGEPGRCGDEARAAYALALKHRHPWYAGELAWWLHQAGEAVEPADFLARPYALRLAGRRAEAAQAWEALGCVYEAAEDLAAGDDEVARRGALARFEALGARPAAEQLRRALAAGGVRGLPRGPRASTRERPFGLTTRELQILQLLCSGLRNAEIAARLHRSVRTVDHHLQAVFAKLGVDSRLAAIQAAQRAGLDPASGQSGQSAAAI